jgi:Restriction endonuclease
VTLGPPPIPPDLRAFRLSDDDVQKLPKVWFSNDAAMTDATRWFGTYALLSILSYLLIFDEELRLSVGYVAGFFGFAFLFMIPFMVLWAIAGFIERAIYIRFNERFARYSAYKNALSAYWVKKADYDSRLAKQREEYWRSLSGVAFERELGELFKRMGYAVQLTSRTADGGVDLFLQKDSKATVVQCKAHNKRIPINVARELAASMRDFGADDAIIACIEGVTKPVEDYIKDKPIKVLTLKHILAHQKEYG